MDPTFGLAEKFRNLVLDQIWEQFLYLVCYGQNIEQLNKQHEKLIHRREAIEHRINEATNNVKQIEREVRRWLDEVDTTFKQVEELHKESQAIRGCSITSCPNPWLRYKLSKSAKEMVQKVSDIYEEGQFNRVSYDVLPPPQVELPDGESSEGIDSRVLIMNQIMEALQSQSINMVGLCGPGGVGKTTITKEVAKNQNKFEKVIMATVSDELNIEKIQGRIAEKLGMQLNEKDEDVRANRLRVRLKQEKNMLLILDDLWEELDLGKAGISFVEGCKILVTSRNKTLLSKGMQCQKIIDVGVLSEDEALTLFKRIAKFSLDSSNPDLISTATEIVQSCRGLPLAIATAAKALEENDLNGCKDLLARLKNHLRRNVTGIKEVDASFKLSYNRLSRENKNIFLLSAMLSHDPSIEDLLVYSVGLDYLVGIENMEEGHVGISTAVSKLKSLNLFLDGSSSHRVTIHDVFREVALLIAHDEFPAFIVRHRTLREWPDENMESCKGICLQQSDIGDFPEELYGPRLEFFLLNSTKHDFSIPSMFFKSSKELKVLAFTNIHFPLLPSLSFLKKLKALCLHSCVLVDITEVGCLRKLKVLSLANSEIEQLPVQLAELTSLLMLNLSHCSNLKVIPRRLLSSLKKLEVLYMGNSFNQWKVEGCSEANNENASLEELRDLPISSLDIDIPHVSMLPENLFLDMNLKRYKIFIGNHWAWQGNYETSKILALELESSIHLTGGVPKLLEGVEDLYLYGSNAYENVLHSHEGRGFPHLRYLQIDGNYGAATKNVSNKTFKSIFNKKVLFPKLEILELSNLNSSTALIWDDQLSHNSVSNLKRLRVTSCGFVKLVPFHVLRYLQNLEELEVWDCNMLETVFDFEDFKDDKEMESSSVVVPLKKLKLLDVPKLKNMFSNNCQGNRHAVTADLCIKDGAINNASNEISKSLFNKVLFPKLEILELSNLNSSIVLIWDDQLSHDSFSNLKRLWVDRCGFVKLVPLHVLKSLNNLEELEIYNCDMLEIVFDFEDFKYDKEMESSSMVVPLKKLELHDLPKLKNVFSNNCQGNRHVVTADLCIKDGATNNSSKEISKSLFNKVLFPKLEILELYDLNRLIALIRDDQLSNYSFSNLKTLMVKRCSFVKLVPFHMLKSLNNLEELEVEDCDMLEKVFDFEDLNDYKEMESSSVVVQLKKLKLSNLPKLKNVWGDHYQGNICFPSLRSVYVSDCESLTSIFPASIAKGMLCDLEELQIHQCAVDVIVAKDPVSESGAVKFEFLRLTSLMLSDLPNLRNFYPQKHTLEWPDLNQISIHCCDELEIFGKEVSCSSEIYEEENILDSKYPLLSHDKVISNLERLTLQGKEVEKIGNGQFLMYHFPELKLLHLSLEKKPFPCQKFWERSPNLGELKLSGDFGGDDVAALAARFPKLTLEKISIMGSLSPSLVSSPNVTHLNVNLCLEWTSLMTSSIARSLVHLTRLSVGHCSEMEEIITKQEGEDDENEEIIFIKLKLLELDSLPRLKRFCRHNYTFKFPLLDKIVITTCLEFKRFSLGLTDTPSLRSVQLSQDHWGQWHDEIWDTNLNKTFYQQRFVASTKVVLDEDDAIMMRNDQFPVDSYRQVEILRIEGFVDEWVTIPYTLLERFPELNALHVKNSSFEQIFPSHAPFSTSFHNLTLLEVSNCHHLVYLVACSAVKSLVNLETLEIRNCEKLEEIVRNETNEDVEGGITFNGLRILKLTHLPKLKTQEDKKDFNIADGTTNTRCTNISRALFSYNKVLLPKLEKLELSYLLNNLLSLKWDDSFSNLKTLFVYHCDFMKLVPLRVLKSLNNLEKLEVSNCGKLEMVFGFEDFNDYRKEMESSSVVVPLSLTHLVVHECHGLISLMTSSVAACLVHITYLSISYCKQLEEIITKQEGEDDEDKEIFFNQMKFLDLKYLPKLKKFCGYNYTFRFPLLEHVTINECPRLTMFCQGAIHALQLQSVRVGNLGPDKDIWMTNLNNTIQHLFTFEEVISTTWSMALNEKNIRTVMAVFPEVRTLYVERFTDEGATFPYNSLKRFPRLDGLYVEHCSFEEIFPPQDQIIDFMGEVSPFKDLGMLSVSGCHQLIHLVTTSTAKSLVSLWCLEIYNCKKMKEIVMNDTNDDVQGGIAFNRLYRIKLTDMPSLKMFSSQSHIFKFPKLEEIEISGCPEMKKFCPGVLKTPKLSKVKIEEHEMEWKDEGNLNKIMEGHSSAKDSLNI